MPRMGRTPVLPIRGFFMPAPVCKSVDCCAAYTLFYGFCALSAKRQCLPINPTRPKRPHKPLVRLVRSSPRRFVRSSFRRFVVSSACPLVHLDVLSASPLVVSSARHFVRSSPRPHLMVSTLSTPKTKKMERPKGALHKQC